MTLEEDVAVLRERLETLESVNRQQARRIEDLEDQTGVWAANGAASLLGGYGFTQIGRMFRFLANGLQVLSPTEDESAMLFVSEFYATEAEITAAKTSPGLALIAGSVTGATQAATLLLESYAPLISTVGLKATNPTVDAELTLVANDDSGIYEVAVSAVGFRLAGLTVDPTYITDGMEWYRSDTDKFRGRANGATDNFAMEDWVTSAVATGDETYAHALLTMGA